MELAYGIRHYLPDIKLNNLQYFVQVIINRLLFHRVLEAINYEPECRLLNWLENGKGFWNQFNTSCKKEYFEKYDGAMYEFQIPDSIVIDDNHFEKFINKLYGFTPYRFDAIEPEFIAEMYDYFLGKELYFNDDSIDIRNKKTSPTGSIPTPPEIAKHIVRNVIDAGNISNEDDLFNCKIVDPCAGSGIFLVTVLDLLISKMKEIHGLEILPYEKIKLIVKNCIYGVDIDPVAIEVLKMTLSLKLVMTQHEKPEPIEKMLGEFSSNFLADEEKYESIMDHSINKAKEIGRHMIEGNIKPLPYKKDSNNYGCKYCNYKGICYFDPKEDEYDNWQLKKTIEDF